MPRDFVINGECLVKVKGGQHMSGRAIGDLSELGLSVDAVRITPRFIHADVKCDDFGPDIPAEVRWQLAEVGIRMVLLHYDEDVLDICLRESMGGGNVLGAAGTMSPAGRPLGRGLPLLASGNNYISLNLTAPILDKPWNFPASYLTGPPVEIPLGVGVTAAVCNWRAIPYKPLVGSGRTFVLSGHTQEIASSGVPLWFRALDD
jgi:hypothetical protein